MVFYRGFDGPRLLLEMMGKFMESIRTIVHGISLRICAHLFLLAGLEHKDSSRNSLALFLPSLATCLTAVRAAAAAAAVRVQSGKDVWK